MPALKKTSHTARVVWLGTVRNRDEALASRSEDTLRLTYAGPAGEDHGGLTRPSCSRVTSQYAKGTEIRNTRQLSIISVEELAIVASEMGIDTLDPSLVGATLVIEGLPDFAHIPPSSRLQAPSGATLTVDLQNRPCTLPHPVIDAVHPGLGNRFKQAAKGRRGVTAWVECEGDIHVCDSLSLHIPDQRPWRPD